MRLPTAMRRRLRRRCPLTAPVAGIDGQRILRAGHRDGHGLGGAGHAVRYRNVVGHRQGFAGGEEIEILVLDGERPVDASAPGPWSGSTRSPRRLQIGPFAAGTCGSADQTAEVMATLTVCVSLRSTSAKPGFQSAGACVDGSFPYFDLLCDRAAPGPLVITTASLAPVMIPKRLARTGRWRP